MGTYLNEGNALYAESVNSEIHVDKSLLIRETAEDEENTRYMQFLRCLLKDRAYVALVWMTGKHPINQHGGICVLDMFSEFSEDEPEPFSLLWE